MLCSLVSGARAWRAGWVRDTALEVEGAGPYGLRWYSFRARLGRSAAQMLAAWNAGASKRNVAVQVGDEEVEGRSHKHVLNSRRVLNNFELEFF